MAKGPEIIIKEIEPEEGFHGGNWKIVYADFVTAMMAFFLLMWILSSVEREELEGVSNYFEITEFKEPQPSGSGNIFGGLTFNEEGRIDIQKHATALDLDYSQKRFNDAPVKKKGLEDENEKGEAKSVDLKTFNLFRSIEDKIQSSINKLPEHLRFFQSSIQVDFLEDNIYISIVDRPDANFFYPESEVLTPEAKELMQIISSHLVKVFASIIIVGINKSEEISEQNVELSVLRANSTRQEMERSGLSRHRFIKIVGLSDEKKAKDTVLDSLLGITEFKKGGENIKIAITNSLYQDSEKRDIRAPSIFNK